MDLPSHPEADDTGAEREPAPTVRWGTVVVVAVVAALLAVIVILHITGLVGPTAH
ncbi:MAG: hypothetical protein ACRD29_08290 [Acidimicrobiales bacterium]